MGNKSSPAHQMPSKAFEFEYINGKCLLQGIRNNNPAEVAAAIDKARKEFTKPVGGRQANESGYQDMVNSMLQYLNKKYDVGDGAIFIVSPIDYCKKLNAHEAKKCIEDNIAKLKASKEFDKANDAIKKGGDVRQGKGQDSERVQLAKDRLKGFLKDKN